MRMPMPEAKRSLTIIWFSGAGALFLLVLILSIVATDASQVAPFWSWYLPTVVPTLSLIVGVLVSDALGSGVKTKMIDRFLYRLTAAISAAYLLVVSLTFLLSPFAHLKLKDLMDMSQLWLGPLQGLASAALGAFFVQKEATDPGTHERVVS